MTRNYGQQGGQQPSLVSVIMTPVILLVLVTVLLISNLVGLIGVLSKGGNINYDEEVVTKYLTTANDKAFKTSSAPGNGYTICVFYDENDKTLLFETAGGNNIRTEAKAFLKPDGKLGTLMQDYLKDEKNRTNFAGCIASSIYGATDEIVKLNLTDSFTYKSDKTNMPAPAVAVDESAKELIKDGSAAVLLALQYLEDKTGITVNLTFDTSAHAFGKKVPVTDVLMVVLLVAIAGLCTFNLVKKIRAYNRIKNDFGDQEPNRIHVNARSPYYDEDDEDEAETEETEEYKETEETEETEDAEEDKEKEDQE